MQVITYVIKNLTYWTVINIEFTVLVFIMSIIGVSWYHFYLRWKSGRPSHFAYRNGFALLPQKPYLFEDDDEVELFRNPVIKGKFIDTCTSLEY